MEGSMTIFASKSIGGFLNTVINLEIPADAKEITRARYLELLDGQSRGKVISFDVDGFPFLADPPSIPLTATMLCSQIDTAADTARRAVAGDPLRAVEYDRAATEAQAFKSAGYPAEAVPRTVAAWAISGRTAQQAADNILLEAAQFNEALYQIREARLGAKELVRQAMANGDVDQAQDITAETIASIESAIAGIGNNA
jgi:hypothetical protein